MGGTFWRRTFWRRPKSDDPCCPCKSGFSMSVSLSANGEGIPLTVRAINKAKFRAKSRGASIFLSSSELDDGRVQAHEFGHFIGLDHPSKGTKKWVLPPPRLTIDGETGRARSVPSERELRDIESNEPREYLTKFWGQAIISASPVELLMEICTVSIRLGTKLR